MDDWWGSRRPHPSEDQAQLNRLSKLADWITSMAIGLLAIMLFVLPFVPDAWLWVYAPLFVVETGLVVAERITWGRWCEIAGV